MEIIGESKEKDIDLVGILFSDDEVRSDMGKLISSIPENVKKEMFTDELGGEKYYDKNGKRAKFEADAVYVTLNNTMVRNFSYKNGNVEMKIHVNKVLYDNGSNNPYPENYMRQYYNLKMHNFLPKVELVYKCKPKPVKDKDGIDKLQVKEVTKVLLEQRATGERKIMTLRNQFVYVPEQRRNLEHVGYFTELGEKENANKTESKIIREEK